MSTEETQGSTEAPAPKTPEQEKADKDAALKKQQEEATEQLESMLKQTNPKNLGQGITRGAGNIVGGAVGAVGIAVLAPTAGLAVGSREGGILGGVVGLAGGAVVGVLGGAVVAVAGVASGLGQVVRGVMSVPDSISQPRKGNWWDENEGKWVATDLAFEAKHLESLPADDKDILGVLTDVPEKSAQNASGNVKETGYYDALEVDPKADPSVIKKKYYVLARQYHPDRVGKDNTEAAEKFKDVAEAYQVLSDPKLRRVYDREGKEGLSGDRTTVAMTGAQIDPALLYAFLFGSDKFKTYVGTLAVASSAAIGDSKKIKWKDARTLQKRRCTRLAILLAERLNDYVNGDVDKAKTEWTKEAEELSSASYGGDLLHLIGQVYSLSGAQFLGSFDSGIGMPSIAAWAKSNTAKFSGANKERKQKRETMFAGLGMVQMQTKHAAEMARAQTDEEREKLSEEFQSEMTATMLKVMWTTTAVDITNTIYEVCQMVFFDKSVDKEKRKLRGRAVKALGDIFMKMPKADGAANDSEHKTAEDLYKEAAEAAMLETIKRKEEAAFRNSSTQMGSSFRGFGKK